VPEKRGGHGAATKEPCSYTVSPAAIDALPGTEGISGKLSRTALETNGLSSRRWRRLGSLGARANQEVVSSYGSAKAISITAKTAVTSVTVLDTRPQVDRAAAAAAGIDSPGRCWPLGLAAMKRRQQVIAAHNDLSVRTGRASASVLLGEE
jgi:hypothetical protein